MKCKFWRASFLDPIRGIQFTAPNHTAPSSHIYFALVRKLAAQAAQKSPCFDLTNALKQIVNRPTPKDFFIVFLIQKQGMNSNIYINYWPPGRKILSKKAKYIKMPARNILSKAWSVRIGKYGKIIQKYHKRLNTSHFLDFVPSAFQFFWRIRLQSPFTGDHVFRSWSFS